MQCVIANRNDLNKLYILPCNNFLKSILSRVDQITFFYYLERTLVNITHSQFCLQLLIKFFHVLKMPIIPTESSPRDSGHSGDEWKPAFEAGSTNSSAGATSRRMPSRGPPPPPPNGG